MSILEKRRIERLKWLESCLKQVIEISENSLKTISSKGLSANYSCNHDVLKWAERAHRASYELWLMSDLSKMISEGKYPTIEVEVQEESSEE